MSGRARPGGIRRRDPKDLTPTRRELEVLRGVAEGWNARRIGRELKISPRTAQNHVARLFRKWGTSSRAHAVAIGFRRGDLH